MYISAAAMDDFYASRLLQRANARVRRWIGFINKMACNCMFHYPNPSLSFLKARCHCPFLNFARLSISISLSRISPRWKRGERYMSLSESRPLVPEDEMSSTILALCESRYIHCSENFFYKETWAKIFVILRISASLFWSGDITNHNATVRLSLFHFLFQ